MEATVSTVLADFYGRIHQAVERLTRGRHWVLKTFLVCVFFSIFLSGGIDPDFFHRGGYPHSYFQKIEHPLLDVAKLYGLNSHEANVNFRLTVPVLFHVLHLHGFWSLPFLAVCSTCLTLVVACVAGFQLTGDRVCAFFLALNVAATYAGSFSFIYYYDATALCELALAALPRMPWWGRGLLTFTACFTDERAFMASGFLLLALLFGYGTSGRFGVARLRSPDAAAVLGGLIGYVLGRLALMKFAHLSSPTGGNGPGMLVAVNFHFLHPAVWYALEGGWLLWALALLVLFARRQAWFGLALLLATLGMLGFGLMIGDVMRSTVYIYPLLFVVAWIVSQTDTVGATQRYFFLAFLISGIGGNYNVYLEKISWFQPLLVQMLQVFAQDVYQHIYHYLPHTLPHRP